MWTRSTRCESTHCLEWRVSSASYSTGNCLEWTGCDCGPHVARVRDSKDPTGPIVTFDADDWRLFIGWVSRG